MHHSNTLALPSSTASCVLAAVHSLPDGILKEGYQVRGAGKSGEFWKAEFGTDATLQRLMVSVFGAVATATATSSANDAQAVPVLPEPTATALEQTAAIDPDEATRREIAKLRTLPVAQFGPDPIAQMEADLPRRIAEAESRVKELQSANPIPSSPTTGAPPTKRKRDDKTTVVAKARIDPESRELLGYISEDFVLLAAKGGLYAYHVESGDELNKEGFMEFCDTHYGRIVWISKEADGSTTHTPASAGAAWLTWSDPMRRVVRRVVMEPTRLGPEDDPCGAQIYNRWHYLKTTMAPVNPTATLADIEIFLNHLMYLSDGDEAVVMYFMNWLATLYQFPDVKIPAAILMYSKVGRIGKSMVYELLKRVFGAPLCASADGASIQSKFMDGLEHKRLMYLNEMARSDKQDGYERFKTLVSEPEQMFEGKGRAARAIKNITHFIITTNNEDALPLMENDGRIAVFRCLSERKSNDYYATLDAWQKGPGPSAVAQVLATWKFPEGWNAMAPVPQTEATHAMQKLNQGELRPIVEELIENRTTPFNRDFGQPAALVTQLAGMYPAVKVNATTLGKVFKSMGLQADHKFRTERHGNIRLCIWRNAKQWNEWARTPEERSAHIESGLRPFAEGDQS